jgi:hypothetical protein
MKGFFPYNAVIMGHPGDACAGLNFGLSLAGRIRLDRDRDSLLTCVKVRRLMGGRQSILEMLSRFY